MKFLIASIMMLTLIATGFCDNNNQTLYQKAELMQNQGKWKQAADVYLIIHKKNPQRVDVLVHLIQISIKLKQFQKAIIFMQSLIALRTDEANLYYELAQLYTETNNRHAAYLNLEKALRFAPKNFNYLKMKLHLANWDNDPMEIEHSTKQMLKYFPNNILALTSKARAASAQRKYVKAARVYKKLLSLKPDKIIYYENLIQVYTWDGQYQKSYQWITRLEKKFPKQKNRSLHLRAWTLAMEGRAKEALNILKPLLKTHPNDKNLLAIKALAEHKLSQIKSQKIIAPNPKLQKLLEIYPLAALNAEHHKHWQKALRIYKEAYRNSHHKYQILLKIAEIQEFLKRHVAASNTLQQALPYTKHKVALYNRIALNYRLAKRYRQAFYYTKKTLTIDPKNRTALLNFAAYQAQIGEIDLAIETYKKILKLYPYNATALIQLALLKSEVGNYRASMQLLESYVAHHGKTKAYSAAKALVYARAGFSEHALHIIKPLLKNNPKNTDYLYTEALAYQYNWQPQAALNTLATLNQLEPQANTVKGLTTFIQYPLRSRVSIFGNFSKDTDTVRIQNAGLDGEWFLSPATRLLFYGKTETLFAQPGSGLNPIDNSKSINTEKVLGGFEHIFNSHFRLKGLLGIDNTKNSNWLSYDFNAGVKVSDKTRFNFIEQRQLYNVSPRSVSLGIRRQLTQIDFALKPSFQHYLNSSLSYASFSDGNRMWQIQLNPMWGIIRTQHWQINLGLYGNWFGFAEQFNNGYYSPDFYQFYGVISHIYYAYSSNIGYSLSVTLGGQKDETFNGFRFANDLSLKAFYGLFKDYTLVIALNSSNRGRSISSGAISNNYEVYSINASLVKRF